VGGMWMGRAGWLLGRLRLLLLLRLLQGLGGSKRYLMVACVTFGHGTNSG
jgi:hypothetical protein